MTCRQCGTEIADKAIVCYRCGTPTAAPAARTPPRRRRPSGWLLAIGAALVVVLIALAVPGAWAHPAGVAVAAALVAIVVRVVAGRRGRRPPQPRS